MSLPQSFGSWVSPELRELSVCKCSDVFEPPNLLSTATTHYLEIRVKNESKLLPQQQYEVTIDLDNSGEEQQSPVVYTGE